MNIRVDLNYPIKDGTEVVFRSPVDCSQVTGLKVYYLDSSQEFVLADAHGNNVGDIPHLFAENVVVKVILDVTTGMAFVQNADTNAYIESTFIKTVNGVKPDENGNVDTTGYSKTVLWQNPSPSGKFSSQTIALSLAEYDAVEIVYMNGTLASSIVAFATTGEMPMLEGYTLMATLNVTGGNAADALIFTNEIRFTMADRETNVPYIVYGIKY
jgi:hypothetical protein